MIVRWGLDSLREVMTELGVSRPLLVTMDFFKDAMPGIERRFTGALPHADVAGVEGTIAASGDADVLVAYGGGSSIDTAKAASVQTGLPIISIPTTYAGAEWTPFFGNRDARTGKKSAGTGAKVMGIVYEPTLMLSLPPFDTCGTAMNALTHAAEALYTRGHTAESDVEALEGARLVTRWLPVVMAEPKNVEARRGLLEGAMHSGSALRVGMGLAHAIAQILGGKYDLPHGALNAVALPHSLRFNQPYAADAIRRLGEAMGTDDPAGKSAELGALGCPMRFRDYKIPEGDLPDVAAQIAERPANKTNPKPATAGEVLEVLRAAW